MRLARPTWLGGWAARGAEQALRINVQLGGKLLDRVKGEVLVAALNTRHVVRGNANALRKLCLSQTQLAPGLCRAATKAFSKSWWGTTRHSATCVPEPLRRKIYL